MFNGKNSFKFSLAIILVGIIISAGVILVRGNFFEKQKEEKLTEDKKTVEMRPISNSDHILGNPNAPIIILEYTDFECPFCKEFHITMKRIIEEYGPQGKVAWVIRNFPIEEIHQNARAGAIAAECVAKYKGAGIYFSFINALFENSPDSLVPEALKSLVLKTGITEQEYSNCLVDESIAKKIGDEIADGKIIYENDPNFGTPYNFIITNSGIQTKFAGSRPYTVIKNIIDGIL